MLTLLTATGARPEAWAICQELMRRQTYKGDVTWVIVDDGVVPQEINFHRSNWNLVVIRPKMLWTPDKNTQASNLLAGLRHVVSERLVIIEDDDCYHPQWLERVDIWLNSHDLVGEAPARYYNIKTKRAQQLFNQNNAALCATAMKGDAILDFAKILKPNIKFIDLNLWSIFAGSKKMYSTGMVIGIKGLPGRKGIGIGHKPDFGKIDQNGDILRQWVGVNFDLYEQ